MCKSPALRLDTSLVPPPLRGYILRSSHTPATTTFPAAPVSLQIHLAHLMGSRHYGLGLRPPHLSMYKLSHAAHLSVHMTFPLHPVHFKLSSLELRSRPCHYPILSIPIRTVWAPSSPIPHFAAQYAPKTTRMGRGSCLFDHTVPSPPPHRHRLHLPEDLGASRLSIPKR